MRKPGGRRGNRDVEGNASFSNTLAIFAATADCASLESAANHGSVIFRQTEVWIASSDPRQEIDPLAFSTHCASALRLASARDQSGQAAD